MNKEELIQLKTATVDALRSVDINSYQLDKADIRLNTYIAGCIGNPEAHNLTSYLRSVVSFICWINTTLDPVRSAALLCFTKS